LLVEAPFVNDRPGWIGRGHIRRWPKLITSRSGLFAMQLAWSPQNSLAFSPWSRMHAVRAQKLSDKGLRWRQHIFALHPTSADPV
jgi:hypothetical protein